MTGTRKVLQREGMKNIFENLIAFPTVSADQKANHEALEYIDYYLSERGLCIKRFLHNGRESLVATTKRTKTPRVMLAAHIDVVPGSPELFKLTERDGKFYGRGTCDMKFAIAAYLQLVDDLQEDLASYDFGIMITDDEELGGDNGVKFLLHSGYRTNVCLLPDGGNDWALEQSAKGPLWLAAVATGKAAHGSKPWEGESAIEKMLLFLNAMQRELFSEQGDDTNTCNIGMVHGGTAPNQVADVCTADIDIRFLTHHDRNRILGRIDELCELYDVSYTLKVDGAAVHVDLTNPYITAFGECIQKATGQPLRTIHSNGGSDARYFAVYDIPTLATYPTGGGRHSDHEWIGVKDFYLFRDVVQDYLGRTAKITQSEPETIKSLTSAQ